MALTPPILPSDTRLTWPASAPSSSAPTVTSLTLPTLANPSAPWLTHGSFAARTVSAGPTSLVTSPTKATKPTFAINASFTQENRA
ncbi:MAG: hypothetical protein Q9183_004910 [Haloplaca sp. 2 TL-2023]